MGTADADALDDPRFDALLASCQEALIAGTPLPAADAVSPELAERLRRGVDCLRRLEKARRPPPVPRIGRFELRRELGRGGFGVVYLAWGPEQGREVALKVPTFAALLSPELRRRFLREARAVAGFDHPNVMPVYEAGEDGPWCYVVSAYCDGVSLADWLADQTALVPPRQAAALVAALADAVQYVHDRGVWHRDIKPSNVLLQLEGPAEGTQPGSACALGGARSTPRLTDFGLAKLLDSDTRHTQSGAVLGTLPYLAPEQADGRLKDVAAATDVYGLGGLLCELLTGRPPFEVQGYAETLRRVISEGPVPPRRLRHKVPRGLQTVCLQCLRKEPGRRYPSARELADDLRRFLEGEPVRARPTPARERMGNWLRRRPALAALAAVAVALPLLLLAVWSSARQQHAGPEEGDRPPPYVETIYMAGRKLADGSLTVAAELLERLRPRPGAPDRRGFEWGCLKRLCQPPPPEVTVLRNLHPVLSLALSPDGKTMAWGDMGGRVVLYDLPRRTVRGALQADQKHVWGLAFSPDGKVLASGGGPPRAGSTR
jgi:hypothetical protein